VFVGTVAFKTILSTNAMWTPQSKTWVEGLDFSWFDKTLVRASNYIHSGGQ